MQDTHLPPGCTQADIDRAATSTARRKRFADLNEWERQKLDAAFIDRVSPDLMVSVLEVIQAADAGGDGLVLWLTRELETAAAAEGVTL